MSGPMDFDESVDILRRRLNDAAHVSDGLPSFNVLMADYAERLADHWYHEAFDELEALGHLDLGASGKVSGDAFGRLSADGRAYLWQMNDIADS